MTIHYHGTPITPREELLTLAGRNFCVSFATPSQVRTVHEIGQSVMLDNGAFTIWQQGGVADWDAWAAWVEPWLDYRTTWCVLPDVIDGTEEENDELLRYCWHIPGAPVWHLHESLERLKRLCNDTNRVCFGSSGQYADVGSAAWQRRTEQAFNAISDGAGRVTNWIHMLRGMKMAGSHYPFASVDSASVGRNFKGSWKQRPRPAALMVAEFDSRQCPARWARVEHEQEAFAV